MDTIDSHILQTCSELECSFFQPCLKSLEQLSVEDNIEFLIRCLWLVSPSAKETLPSWKLSPNIFERFQMASSLTDLLKKHNVRGDFGYQTLLYGRTVEMRQVLIAVIEKLPKYSSSRNIEQSAVSSLLNSVRRSLDSLTWVPEFCRRLHMRRDGRLWVPPDSESDFFFLSSSEKSLWHAVSYSDSRSALANIIRSCEVLGGVFPPRLKPPLHAKPRYLRKSEPQNNSDLAPPERATFVQSSAIELNDRKTPITHISGGSTHKEKALIEIENEIGMLRSKTASIIESFDPKSDDLITFLMDSETWKAKILAYLETNEDRMEKLEKEFRESREELVCELKRLKNQRSEPQEAVKCREKLEKLQYKTSRNEHIAEELKKRLESTKNRDIDRVLIVRRIMEMTASIQKQNEEINKRELKWLTQTLHRTFSTIEEALFKEVEDQKGERAYKLFGKLHLSCMASVEAIERNGALARQNEELLDLVEVEKQNRFDDQLNRIQADLEIIVNENKRLENLLAETST